MASCRRVCAAPDWRAARGARALEGSRRPGHRGHANRYRQDGNHAGAARGSEDSAPSRRGAIRCAAWADRAQVLDTWLVEGVRHRRRGGASARRRHAHGVAPRPGRRRSHPDAVQRPGHDDGDRERHESARRCADEMGVARLYRRGSSRCCAHRDAFKARMATARVLQFTATPSVRTASSWTARSSSTIPSAGAGRGLLSCRDVAASDGIRSAACRRSDRAAAIEVLDRDRVAGHDHR